VIAFANKMKSLVDMVRKGWLNKVANCIEGCGAEG